MRQKAEVLYCASGENDFTGCVHALELIRRQHGVSVVAKFPSDRHKVVHSSPSSGVKCWARDIYEKCEPGLLNVIWEITAVHE